MTHVPKCKNFLEILNTQRHALTIQTSYGSFFLHAACGGAGGLGSFGIICGVFLSYCVFICCMLILCYSQFQGGKCSDMASLNVNSPFKFLCWFGYT